MGLNFNNYENYSGLNNRVNYKNLQTTKCPQIVKQENARVLTMNQVDEDNILEIDFSKNNPERNELAGFWSDAGEVAWNVVSFFFKRSLTLVTMFFTPVEAGRGSTITERQKAQEEIDSMLVAEKNKNRTIKS